MDAPLWKPPSPRWCAKEAIKLRNGRTPRRCAAGASEPLGKAASACALAPAAAPPPLRLGAFAPLPPAFPKGKSLPIMRASAWDNVRNGFCGQRPRKSPGSSCREAARSSVTPLARIAAAGRASATASGGIPKVAQPSLASLCLLSAGQKVGARRGLSASKD